MSTAERNYPVHEQELLAVIHALQKWKMLLLGMKVNVMTDHHSLTYLLKQRNLSRRQARWTEILADFELNFEYIRGEDNTVADALSRKEISDKSEDINIKDVACVAALTELGTELSDSLKKRILEGYTIDPFCKALQKVLPLREDCFEKEGLLFVDGRLLIPKTEDLRINLMKDAHERLGHLGYLKTVTELRRDFFWPGLSKGVRLMVQGCVTCQRTKTATVAPTGKMMTPPLPSKPLQHLAIDFVGPLKGSNHYDMILTCTCRLSGFTRIIPVLQKDTAEKTASRFFTGWLAIFGAPSTIISDRDKTWTSRFWKAIMERISTQFHMTTAFHPQADGRSKRTNKTVGQILRTYTAKRQSRWLEALPAAEFAINSAINVATGVSPMELVFGTQPRLFPSTGGPEDEPLSVKKWIRQRENAWMEARDALWTSRIRQALQHNKRCRDLPPIEVGSWVLLDSADWRSRHQSGTDKLKERFKGPYQVLRVFNNGQTVVLDLPEGDGRHPSLHVSKVKQFFQPDGTVKVEPTKVSSTQ
jgi:hypothetical protein